MIPITDVPVACTVTEPVDGGATSVTFSCEASPEAVCQADNRVEFPDTSTPGEATITVTNTFEEPTPAAIEVTPGFTG